MKNLLLRYRALRRPEMYHGWGRSSSYFEGWYLKCVSEDEQYAIAFIPGVSMDKSGQTHAFLQVMYGTERRSAYHRFSMQEFEPSTQSFAVCIGDNFFSDHGLLLDLPDIKGELSFLEKVEWPGMPGAPGIMGWYSYVPFMQCFHGLVSMNHRLMGSLIIDGKEIDFTGGKGYIEKDWGRSFPSSYVWMQCNNFGDTNASLMASVAHIPFLGSYFIGFISGFWLEGKLYRFATYTGAKKQVRIKDDSVEIDFITNKNSLHIKAWQAPGVTLIAPQTGAMTGKINESLQARIEVQLYENKQLIFEGTGTSAGLELCLDLDNPNILLR